MNEEQERDTSQLTARPAVVTPDEEAFASWMRREVLSKPEPTETEPPDSNLRARHQPPRHS